MYISFSASKMSVWRLENICIRYIVSNFDQRAPEALNNRGLPRWLLRKLERLREQMRTFERVHVQLLDIKSGLPILLTDDTQLDWIAVVYYCINRYLADTAINDPLSAMKAFGLAAVNGLEDVSHLVS